MRFRIVQVGLGGFGRRWMRTILGHQSWEYAGLVTRNKEVLKERGRECNLEEKRLFSDLESALRNIEDADTVLITTPYFKHAEEALVALAHGKNVIVEKPLCGNFPDALRIRDAVRESGKSLMVSENYRFSPAPLKIKEIIESGEIGSPEYICIQYFVRHSFREGDWRNRIEYPVLIENSTHHFDLLRFVTGKEALAISCFAFGSKGMDRNMDKNIKPSVSAHIEMEDSLHVNFCASWAYSSFRTPWTGNWWIRGTEGGVQFNPEGITLSKEGNETHIPIGDDRSNSLSGVLDEFTDSLIQKRSPSVDIEDNVKTIGISMACIESSEKRRLVTIQDLYAGR